MSSAFEKSLGKYAEVVVKVGLNLQAGQRLLIGAPIFGVCPTPIELAPFVRLIATQAYKNGARLVDVIWDDEQLRLIRLKHAPKDSFEEFPKWQTDGLFEVAQAGDAVLSIYAETPDLLGDQNPELLATVQRTTFEHIEPSMNLIVKSAFNWCMITAPVDGWTDKLFPDLSPEDRKARFWDTVFEICRVNVADPVSKWRDHIKQLAARSSCLNDKKYSALRLIAPGTDLTVGLPKGHVWRSGSLTSLNGIDFTANIPTEEVFTMPHKDQVEGVVAATKPLSYRGSSIEDFSLTFSEGKIIKASARKGEESLRRLIKTDEGASRIGEVSLVPHSSPISRLGMVFHNILIDENASNHIAFGRAYKFSMTDGESMSDDEFAAVGGNHSMIHLDFMVGSDEMNVDGITQGGHAEPIMRSGEWTFDIS